MKSPTKSAYWGERSRLRQVDLDPKHHRSGRWVLLAQGLVLCGLGVAGLLARGDAAAGAAGQPVLMLRLTPLHSGALLAFGVLAVGATPWRRATNWITALSLVAATLAFTIGVTAATDSSYGPWGMDFGDAWLHGSAMVIDLALLIWLLPDELQDPGWVWKRGAEPEETDRPDLGTRR
jgi:hypothetical protein